MSDSISYKDNGEVKITHYYFILAGIYKIFQNLNDNLFIYIIEWNLYYWWTHKNNWIIHKKKIITMKEIKI